MSSYREQVLEDVVHDLYTLAHDDDGVRETEFDSDDDVSSLAYQTPNHHPQKRIREFHALIASAILTNLETVLYRERATGVIKLSLADIHTLIRGI